jgi:hypothetical protein
MFSCSTPTIQDHTHHTRNLKILIIITKENDKIGEGYLKKEAMKISVYERCLDTTRYLREKKN